MGEELMQYVWSAVQFDFVRLKTTDGRDLQLLQPGILNRNAGPDFNGSRILMDYLDLTGDIEIHTRSREWYAHRHHLDPRYNSVILHVVWEEGKKPVLRQDGTEVPELVLRGRIPAQVIERYQYLKITAGDIPCHSLWKNYGSADWESHVNDMGRMRLLDKARQLLPRLRLLKEDRRQLLWEEIAGGMGGMNNRDAFRALAREVPLKVVLGLSDHLFALEAVLLGAAGLLGGDAPDDYFRALQAEWKHLAYKYKLGTAAVSCSFLRMRPDSLPHLRIAQLAGMMHRLHFPEELFLGKSFEFFRQQDFSASPYWDTHHTPGVWSPAREKRIGQEQKLHMIINTLLPVELVLRSGLEQVRAARVILGKLEEMPPEDNSVIRYYAQFGVYPRNALQGQGLIGLRKTQCDQRRCLDCRIGQQLIGAEPA